MFNPPFHIGDVNIYDYQIFGIRRWNTYVSWCESFGPKTMVIA